MHQARRDRWRLALYAADESLESLEELTAWVRGEGAEEDQDALVERAAAAMELLARVSNEGAGT